MYVCMCVCVCVCVFRLHSFEYFYIFCVYDNVIYSINHIYVLVVSTQTHTAYLILAFYSKLLKIYNYKSDHHLYSSSNTL